MSDSLHKVSVVIVLQSVNDGGMVMMEPVSVCHDDAG